MKNGHNDVLRPIRAIPFILNADSFLAGGFSTLSPWASGPRKLMKNVPSYDSTSGSGEIVRAVEYLRP